jgi:hypothetical protein
LLFLQISLRCRLLSESVIIKGIRDSDSVTGS